jgi:hypothetical protein
VQNDVVRLQRVGVADRPGPLPLPDHLQVGVAQLQGQPDGAAAAAQVRVERQPEAGREGASFVICETIYEDPVTRKCILVGPFGGLALLGARQGHSSRHDASPSDTDPG